MPNHRPSIYEQVEVWSAVLEGWTKKRYGLAWEANLYAPQGVDLGGGGLPLKKWNDSEWKVARAVKSCEAHSIILQVFYSVLYQVPNLLTYLLT